MKSMTYKTLFSLLLIFCFSDPIAAQVTRTVFTESKQPFSIGIGGDLEYSTPQKYGAGVNLYVGSFTKRVILLGENNRRFMNIFRGLNLEAMLSRGGYRLGAYYFDLQSFVGPAGFRVGLTYLSNNSYSTVLKRRDLIGIEAELQLLFTIKAGALKEVDGDRIIPTIGFGVAIGPNMFKN